MSTRRKKSAPMRSILLTKQMRGTLYLLAWRQTVSVCGSTPATRVEHRDRAVEHAQRALDLDGEVDVAGRVDDVDPVVAPLAGGGRRRDGDAALLLLDHPVHDRGALVDLADLVGLAGVVEDALGRRGLARVDVGHDPDVAGRARAGTRGSCASASLSGRLLGGAGSSPRARSRVAGRPLRSMRRGRAIRRRSVACSISAAWPSADSAGHAARYQR